METKTCSKCGETKPIDAFVKRSTRCKACFAFYMREYRKGNKERIAEQRKALRDANVEAFKTREAAWRKKNAEHLAAKRGACKQIRAERYAVTKNNMPDSFVRSRLRMKDAPNALIEMKREQIALYRLTKQLNEVIKEKRNGDE